VDPTRKDVALFDEAPENVHRQDTEGLSSIRFGIPPVPSSLPNFPNCRRRRTHWKRKAILRAVEPLTAAPVSLFMKPSGAGVTVIVTADHGTVEKWIYPDGAI